MSKVFFKQTLKKKTNDNSKSLNSKIATVRKNHSAPICDITDSAFLFPIGKIKERPAPSQPPTTSSSKMQTNNDLINWDKSIQNDKLFSNLKQKTTNFKDITHLHDISDFKKKSHVQESFKACNRTLHLVNVMYDIAKKEVMPPKTNIECWWCRHSFKGTPIGIPLKYVTPDNRHCSKKCVVNKKGKDLFISSYEVNMYKP